MQKRCKSAKRQIALVGLDAPTVEELYMKYGDPPKKSCKCTSHVPLGTRLNKTLAGIALHTKVQKKRRDLGDRLPGSTIHVFFWFCWMGLEHAMDPL